MKKRKQVAGMIAMYRTYFYTINSINTAEYRWMALMKDLNYNPPNTDRISDILMTELLRK